MVAIPPIQIAVINTKKQAPRRACFQSYQSFVTVKIISISISIILLK
jgi:hypothetical protein